MDDMLYAQLASFAYVAGSPAYADISGYVYFYEVPGGTVVLAELTGFSQELEETSGGFLGFHIHEGSECTGNEEDPFANTRTHYNPDGREHPDHAGDLPPLMISNGAAFMEVYTGRFTPMEIVGNTVVIHQMPDDFRTQPSGDSGAKIACGKIVAYQDEV